jgi:glyoxylase-like metal-dependent hydrolase (beta-lactamase superfamily II)
MTTRHRCTLLRAGTFRLDAGNMFGLIPRVVWSRTVTPDDRNRVTLQHNCLLLERVDDVPTPATTPTAISARLPAPKLILLETGTGDKLDPASRDLFAMDDQTIHTALDKAQCNPADIGAVVCSHLHFDHAGALTRLLRPGEAPAWTGQASSFGAARGDHSVALSFPNATLFTQAREWADALAARSVMTRTYFADHLLPLKQRAAELVRLIDSPPPHPVASTPDRDTPPLPQHARETQVTPGVFVFRVPGHTWGQQATRFTDERGRTIVFVPDVIPTAWHVGQAYSLGYDVEPYTSMISRTWLLREACEKGWVLMLNHEPGHPFFTVKPNAKGWYDLDPAH